MSRRFARALKHKGRLSTHTKIRDFSNRNLHLKRRAETENTITLSPSGTVVDGQHRRHALKVFVVSDTPN
jgi:hypothetical protein